MRGSYLSVLFAVVVAVPVQAADVFFSGTLSGVCTLGISTPGTLGMSADGSLGSAAGLPAILTILSVGTNTLTINPPVWEETPPGYTAGTETLEVAYLGLAGLGVANQAYTSSITTRTLNTLPLSLLTMNARATNTLGFDEGDYEMKVVVTCS